MKLRLFTTAAVLLSSHLFVAAADRPSIPAYTDPQQVDDDYRFQGEYAGWQRSRPSARSSERIGIQVIALGDGDFAATKYYRGLPGAGWYGQDRFEYRGKRSGDVVHLQGAEYELEVDGETAQVFTLDGRRAGELKKVERQSPTLGAPPPPGAIVLFDGEHADRLVDPRITPDGLLQVGTETKDSYGDFRLHLEFRLPYKPLGRGQDRGNSGLYVQGRYELQILDSFGLPGIENECGALYRLLRPDFNMCYPPLTWQTYDVDFTQPVFSDGKKVADARISLWHNGILVQNNVAVPGKTGAGKAEGPDPLPTILQDHKNPVLFRNIWLLPKPPGTPASADWVKSHAVVAPVAISAPEPPLALIGRMPGFCLTGSAIP